jgi:glycosyltransferase involved in cell wall biosynthesis
MNISVILPVRNEEALVEKTLDEICTYLKKRKTTFEVLAVENGSSDQTQKIINKVSRRYKQVRLVKALPGYGQALRKGLKTAKGKYIIVFNADFYDLSFLDFPEVDLFGKDLIIGSKLTSWSRDDRPFSRHLVSKSFNLLLKILFGFEGTDTHGIKAMRKSVVDKVLPFCKTKSGIFDSELVIRTQRMGYQLMDYPVKVSEIRKTRFPNRLLATPTDIYNLYKALGN